MRTALVALVALGRAGGAGGAPTYSQPPDILFSASDFANGTWPTHRDSLEAHTAIIEGAPQRVGVRDGLQHSYDTQNVEPDRAPTQHVSAERVTGVHGGPDTSIKFAAGLDADPDDAMTICSVTKWAGSDRNAHRIVLSAGMGYGDTYQGHFQDAAGQRHVGATRWGTTAFHANGAARVDVEGREVQPFKIAPHADGTARTASVWDWAVVCASNGSPYAFLNGVEHGVPHAYADASTLIGRAWPEVGINIHSEAPSERSAYVVAEVAVWHCAMGYAELQHNSAALLARVLGFEDAGGPHVYGDAQSFAHNRWTPSVPGYQNLMSVGRYVQPFEVETANAGWQARLGGATDDYTVPRLHSDLGADALRALFDDDRTAAQATEGAGTKYVQIEWSTGHPIVGDARRASIAMVRLYWGRAYAQDFDITACAPGTTAATSCELAANWKVVARVRGLHRFTYEDNQCVCNLPHAYDDHYGDCANGACNPMGVCGAADGLGVQAGEDADLLTVGAARFSDHPSTYTEHMLSDIGPWAALRIELLAGPSVRYSPPSEHGVGAYAGCANAPLDHYELTEIEVLGAPVATWVDTCADYDAADESAPEDAQTADGLPGDTGKHVFDYTRNALYPILRTADGVEVNPEDAVTACPSTTVLPAPAISDDCSATPLTQMEVRDATGHITGSGSSNVALLYDAQGYAFLNRADRNQYTAGDYYQIDQWNRVLLYVGYQTFRICTIHIRFSYRYCKEMRFYACWNTAWPAALTGNWGSYCETVETFTRTSSQARNLWVAYDFSHKFWYREFDRYRYIGMTCADEADEYSNVRIREVEVYTGSPAASPPPPPPPPPSPSPPPPLLSPPPPSPPPPSSPPLRTCRAPSTRSAPTTASTTSAAWSSVSSQRSRWATPTRHRASMGSFSRRRSCRATRCALPATTSARTTTKRRISTLIRPTRPTLEAASTRSHSAST